MKKAIALLMAAVMVLGLAACGSSGSTASTTAAATAAATEAAMNTEAATEAVSADWTEADATETLIYHMSGSSSTLSKWAHTSNYFLSAADYLIFDSVVTVTEDGEYAPWLAESYALGDDGLSFTFTVRDGVYFQNGQQCTGADVKFTFEQLRDDSEHYPDSVVKNWRNYLGEIEVADDGMTVTLNFTQQFPEFWKLISSPDVQIVPADYAGMSFDDFWNAPIGTGAYKVTSWDAANSKLELELRDDENGYWGYDYAGTYTNVKYIKEYYSTEATTRLASLRSGEIDIIDTVPTGDVEGLTSEGFVCTSTTPGNCVFLEFACAEDDPFGDARLRQALSMCIDRELIVDALLDGYGFAAEYLCRSTDLGWSDDSSRYYTYDKDAAKALVDECIADGTYDGSALNFIYTTSTVNIGPELCQYIQSAAQEIGLNLEINVLETALYDDARSAHEFDLCLACIANSGNMWYKQAHDVVGTDRFNSGCYNEELLNLGLALGETADQEKMNDILDQMYTIMSDTMEVYVNVYFPTIVFAQNSGMAGVQWHNYLIPDLSTCVK